MSVQGLAKRALPPPTHTPKIFPSIFECLGFLDWNHTLLRSGAGGAVFQLLNKILSHLTIETSLS